MRYILEANVPALFISFYNSISIKYGERNIWGAQGFKTAFL